MMIIPKPIHANKICFFLRNIRPKVLGISMISDSQLRGFHYKAQHANSKSKLLFKDFKCPHSCSFSKLNPYNSLLENHLNTTNVYHLIRRFKSKKKKSSKQDSYESSDEEDNKDDVTLDVGKDFRDKKVKVDSFRMDAILKGGLGISRNKVEELFYGNKIKINKEKIKKKSARVEEGDTIDILKPVTEEDNPLTEVDRLIFLKAIEVNQDSGKVTIILRKYSKILFSDYKKDIKHKKSGDDIDDDKF